MLNNFCGAAGMKSIEAAAIVLIILLGVSARVINIDRKAYWSDEAFTSLELSGHRPDEAKTDILTGRLVGIPDLERYQFPDRIGGKSLDDTVRDLANIEPQLTPLYFIIARYWVNVFGPSVIAIRSLSVLFGLAIMPLAFWLVMELFGSKRAAWIAVALIAVSPFHVLFSQEARPYSIWTAMILLTCVAFLRAVRQGAVLAWAVYCVVAALSLYCYLLSILVIIGLVLYVMAAERFRATRSVVLCTASSLLASLSFLPWPYRGEGSGSGNTSLTLSRLAMKWVRNVAVFFVDFDFNDATRKLYLIPYSVLLLVLLGFVAFAICFTLRRADRQSRFFLAALIGVTATCMGGLDLASGSSRSTVTRYLARTFLGVEIAVAYMLAIKTRKDDAARPAWAAIGGFLLILGARLSKLRKPMSGGPKPPTTAISQQAVSSTMRKTPL